MDIKLFNYFNESKFKLLYDKTNNNNRQIQIYKFNNCCLTGHSLFYPNVLIHSSNMPQLILPVYERTMSLKTSTIYEITNMKFDTQNINILPKISEDLVFFFIYNTDNYYHFLYDTLPYLISYLELKKTFSNLKLLVQYPNPSKKSFYPFFLEFLELLNINITTDILIAESNIQYKTVFLSNSYSHDFDSNYPPHPIIYSFYQNIVLLAKQKIQNNNKLIIHQLPERFYISRRTWIHNDFTNIGTNYTQRRKLVNEDELVTYLNSKNISEIFTEKLSTLEKIILFSKAELIIGVIGGGCCNVVFSPKNTRLITIVSPTFLEVNTRFQYCLNQINTIYYYNTKHSESSNIKTYMRIKATIKNKNNEVKNIVGEIEKINGNEILISYTDGSNTGWNSEINYQKCYINYLNNPIELLDQGLNSPFELINISEITSLIS